MSLSNGSSWLIASIWRSIEPSEASWFIFLRWRPEIWFSLDASWIESTGLPSDYCLLNIFTCSWIFFSELLNSLTDWSLDCILFEFRPVICKFLERLPSWWVLSVDLLPLLLAFFKTITCSLFALFFFKSPSDLFISLCISYLLIFKWGENFWLVGLRLLMTFDLGPEFSL